MSEKSTNQLIAAKKYWMSQLCGNMTDINFICDFPRIKKRKEKSETVKFEDTQVNKLVKICKNDDNSLFVFLLSVFNVLLFKMTGNERLYVTAPLLNSQDQDNCIIILNNINSDESFREVLVKTKKLVIDGYKNHVYPIKKIINMLNLDGNISPFKFFFLLNTIHNIEKIRGYCEKFGNDLIFYVKRSDQEIELEIIYNEYLFNGSTIKLLLKRFTLVMDHALDNIAEKIKNYKIGNEEEMKVLVRENYRKSDVAEKYFPPEGEVEKKLADIWAELLEIDRQQVSVNDDFFELGGHSLKATRLNLKLYKEFNTKIPFMDIFKNPTIKMLSEYIRFKQKDVYVRIPAAEPKEFYTVSSAQKRLYFLQKIDSGNTSYNMTEVYILEGDIDRYRLVDTFSKLIQRHESLRTAFELKGDDIVQRILARVDFDIEFFEVEQDKLYETIHALIRPFDLSKAPLIRVGLIKFKYNTYALVLDMHHIISDGLSNNILIKDFLDIYSGLELSNLKLTYKDYAEWQQKQGVNVRSKKQYWIDMFNDEIPVLNIITDYVRPDIQSFDGDRIEFVVGEEITRQLKQVALKENTTIFMILMALFFTFLHRLSNQDDIVIGTVTSGRTHLELHDMVGMFVNTLPIWIKTEKNEAFNALLNNIKKTVIEAFENQECQFEDVIDELHIDRNTNRNPLFDVMLVLGDSDTPDFVIPGMELKRYGYKRNTSKFDITLFAAEKDGNIYFEMEYCTRLFKRSTVERYVTYFKSILAGVVQNPCIGIRDIEILSLEEKSKLLYDFNRTELKYSDDKTVQELFAICVDKNPGNVAIIYKDREITYRELKELSDSLAKKLVQLEAAKGDIIGLLMDNSPELIVGILGILKTGAAYLPIDPDFPEERKRFMLEDCGCKILLSKSSIDCGDMQGIQVVNIDELDLHSVSADECQRRGNPDDIIYIIYTSGSTGTPKGCLIKQKGVINYIEWAVKQYFGDGPAYFPFYSSVAYDLTVTSIFAPLLSGNTMVIYPKEIGIFDKVLRDDLSNIIKVTPTHLRLLLDCDFSESAVRKIIVGGEQLTTELAGSILSKFNGEVEIFNEYGPTETVVGCMIHKFNPEKDKRSAVPIGIPVQNTQIYILDGQLNICPVGVAGELYIGGAGVSPGYINRPGITKERFLANPYGSHGSERLYKTGDLAFYMDDGLVEYIGRKDAQVKIRGYRVEIEEIERSMLSYPGVKNAIVIVKEGNFQDKILCGYFVSEYDIDVSEVKNFLTRRLPDYMVPSFILKLESLPIATGGKINLKALPEPDTAYKEGIEIPANDIEKYFFDVWSQKLNILNFGVNDNFFEIGGNSFLLMMIYNQINKDFPEIKITDFFKYTTICDIARYIISIRTEQKVFDMDLTVKLPYEYFCADGKVGTKCHIVFRLSKETSLSIKALTEEYNVSVRDVFISLFAFVLFDVSKNEIVKVQTWAPNKGEKMLSLDVNFNDSDEMDKLFVYVNKKLNSPGEDCLYGAKDLTKLKFNKKQQAVIPFIGANRTASFDLTRFYDIFVRIDEKADEFEFECSYNQDLLKSEMVEELIQLYAGLLDNICKQFAIAGV